MALSRFQRCARQSRSSRVLGPRCRGENCSLQVELSFGAVWGNAGAVSPLGGCVRAPWNAVGLWGAADGPDCPCSAWRQLENFTLEVIEVEQQERQLGGTRLTAPMPQYGACRRSLMLLQVARAPDQR